MRVYFDLLIVSTSGREAWHCDGMKQCTQRLLTRPNPELIQLSLCVSIMSPSDTIVAVYPIHLVTMYANKAILKQF